MAAARRLQMPSYPGHSLLMDLLEMSILKDQRCVETAKVCPLDNRQLQKRERTGKEYGCFPFV